MAVVSADPPQDTPRPLDEPDLRDEQAALRRVATAVAEQRTPDEIFTILTREVAMLFGATGASLVKFEPGDKGRVIADWSVPGTSGLEPGARIDFQLDSALQRVYVTSAAARIDAYPDADDSVAASSSASGPTPPSRRR